MINSKFGGQMTLSSFLKLVKNNLHNISVVKCIKSIKL